ncbi:kinase-like domain-containing protein [Tirmania nivea]|nr:kinase-like domain-containing protein [Tirmania nivea]
MPLNKNKHKTTSTTKNQAANGNTPLSSLPNNKMPVDAKANGKPTKPAALGVQQSKSTPKSAPAHQPALDYKEVQRNEVEVLQSIWMEDYIPVVKTGAWNTSIISFNLCLRPSSLSSGDDDLGCTLSVTMTATYPKTVPELKIIDPKGLRPHELEKLNLTLSTLPGTLVGQEMVHDIAAAIQDNLEDIVQMRKTSAVLPTFYDQRLKEEEAKREQERKREEEARLQQEKADLEAERVMGAMVEKEKKKRREKAKEAQGKKKPAILGDDDDTVSSDDQVVFDRDVIVESRFGGPQLAFRKVSGMVQVAQGPLTAVYTVKPIMPKDQSSSQALVLKSVELENNYPNCSDGKRQIQLLEIELDKLRMLRHANITDIYESKVVSIPMITRPETTGWKVSILMEYADKGSLRDLLETVGTIDVHIARSWTIQLLEGLDYIHSKGVFHMALHPGNILLFKPASGGSTTAKLSDVCYTNLLLKIRDVGKDTAASGSSSALWSPPETTQYGMKPNRKQDIWNLGVVFLQMVFGLGIMKKYDSPETLMNSMGLHESLQDFLEHIFTADHKKRPTAFDLLPSEFLRNNDPVFSVPNSPTSSKISWTLTGPGGKQDRQRLGSNSGSMSLSRYANDFSEVGRLGKGGFGEVVKARNRLDGRMYAIKKITQTHGHSLTEVLSEVMLLSRLNHQYVVRYFTAWLEDDYYGHSLPNMEGTSTDEEVVIFEDDETGSESQEDEEGEIDFSRHTDTGGGLDFISDSGYPKIQFGYGSDDEESEEEEQEEQEGEDDSEKEEGEDEDGDGSEGETASALSKSDRGKKLKVEQKKSKAERKGLGKGKVTLYIQMELCQRQTLRDLLQHDLHLRVDECWRLLRQILEGLAHVHGLGIIHRDLKPDNIFIDATGNPRIGDFGLATSGQTYHDSRSLLQSDNQDGDLTTDVGTALYVAPELRSHGQGKYNEKVDMYSLGIIFFEMCHPLKTAMEREHVIRQLRQRDFSLPPEFQGEKKDLQASIIKSLINHRPSERPTSAELLASGKLPLGVEDETMRQALKTFSDPNNPYHQKLMRVLFAQAPKEYKDMAYDSGRNSTTAPDLLLQTQVKEKLISIFRKHGAVEVDRPVLFPRSRFYPGNAVQLLDSTGTLLQLPYDLTLPNARALAKEEPPCAKTYTFGTVYREKPAGGQPFSHLEVDFDFVSFHSEDLALKEAEVVKVIDEVVDMFPPFRNAQICYHINHGSLLDIIMEFCRIDVPARPIVKDVLSRLNTAQWAFSRIRNELRGSVNLSISATSIDELARFDFHDEPEKCFHKLRNIFADTPCLEKSTGVFAHISEVVMYIKRFGVARKIYLSPLGTYNEKFCRGGLLFQCLYDQKRRDVIAAGGRYDSLIADHKPRMRGAVGAGGVHHHSHHHHHPWHGHGHSQGALAETHAVGFSLSWEKLLTAMSRHHRNLNAASTTSRKNLSHHDFVAYGGDDPSAWATRRCDVLVASFDPVLLRTEGVDLVQRLWKADIKAELACDAPGTEGLMQVYRGDGFGWMVILKPAVSGVVQVEEKDRVVKVRNLFKREDEEIKLGELVVWLKAEIAERDKRVAAVVGMGGDGGEGGGEGGKGKKHKRRG